METLQVAFEAIMPLFIFIIIGLLVKRSKILNPTELKHVNGMVFAVFLAVTMFYNIFVSKVDLSSQINLVIFAIAAVLVVFVIDFGGVCFAVKDNKERGAIIQAIYRTNFIILGIPIVANIFGMDKVGITTVLVAIIVPLYNILAVITLETFRGGKFSAKKIILGIFHNPLIQAAILAVILRTLGINLPSFILKPLNQIRMATTPIALIVLGASFSMTNSAHKLKELIACVFCRLVVVPGIVLPVAFFYGFRGVEFVTLISLFSTPSAVSSFAMAQQLDSDAELAGNAVVYTSAFSSFTMFMWLVIFKNLGAF
ncbi:MAG: AEC family transporter [Acidaminococcaceae bacterium]|jgi:predicted permease|nr:AEC family transporter [Acidaminococcaceae bacterium]